MSFGWAYDNQLQELWLVEKTVLESLSSNLVKSDSDVKPLLSKWWKGEMPIKSNNLYFREKESFN